VGKIAKYLTRFGHDVKVISAQDGPGLRNLELEVPENNVIYTKWFKFVPERLSAGTLDFFGNSRRLYGITRKCWRAFCNAVYFPDAYAGWIPYAVGSANKTLRTWKPDIIYVSALPYSSLIMVSYIAAKFKVPWMADLRDLWTDNHCHAFSGVHRYIERKIENRVLSSANGITTVSEPLAQKLRSRFPGPVEVVCNGYDVDDYGPFTSSGGYPKDERIRIVYTGTICDGFQDPSPLFLALKNFTKNKVKAVFYGAYRPYFHSLVKRMGIEDKVEIKGLVSYKESLCIQRNADILLYLLWTDTKEKGVYAGKFFEYIGARRPILGVGPNSGVAADLIKERGLGVILNSRDDIYEQLNQWLEEKKRTGFIPYLPMKPRDELSREDQTRKLEKFMQKIAGKQ
jgi:glycosyltransferase involved in cell wall biosynthesis